jgi:hypothetical protein
MSEPKKYRNVHSKPTRILMRGAQIIVDKVKYQLGKLRTPD